MHDAINLEASTTAEADTTTPWDAVTVYQVGDVVLSGDTIYTSARANNINRDPASNRTVWLPTGTANPKAIYDVYPDTVTTNTAGALVITYNVTDVDIVFIGNAKGTDATISLGGSVTKNLLDATVSPNQAWGIVDDYHGSGDLFYDIGALTSGTLTITITPNAGVAHLGYVMFGEAVEVGCTLMSEAVKYNVRSGVQSRGTVVGIERAKRDSWIEMTLPIAIHEPLVMSDVLVSLAKYRGVPMLAIGDDTGLRPEMVFWGLFHEIEASITERNGYVITLTSLDTSTYIPATELELATAEQEEEANNPTLADFIFWGFDTGTNAGIVFGNLDITGYYDGLALATEVLVSLDAGAYIDVNGLGQEPIFRNGVALLADTLIAGQTYLFYYQNARFNVATHIPYNYGNIPVINGLVLEYIDENENLVSKPMTELIANIANDATIVNNVMTYTDDTDGVTVVLIEDLLNQAHYGEADKGSRHHIKDLPSLEYATETVSGLVELATTAEAQAGVNALTVLTPFLLQQVTATTTRAGVIRLATQAEVDAGLDAFTAVTPATLKSLLDNSLPTPATQAEVDARTDAVKYLTPLTLEGSEAKTTQKGIIEIATCAEVETGTDTERAVTPACLSAYVDVGAVAGIPTVANFTTKDVVFDYTTCTAYTKVAGVVTACGGGGGGGAYIYSTSNGIAYGKFGIADSGTGVTITSSGKAIGDGSFTVVTDTRNNRTAIIRLNGTTVTGTVNFVSGDTVEAKISGFFIDDGSGVNSTAYATIQ